MNTVFVGRKATGEIWSPALAAEHPDRDWILTRILWLEGTEAGFNHGGDVDSRLRSARPPAIAAARHALRSSAAS